MSSFLIAPEGYSKEQTLQYLQALKWGYEIRLTNVQWTDETNFTLIYKTNQQQTTEKQNESIKLPNETTNVRVKKVDVDDYIEKGANHKGWIEIVPANRNNPKIYKVTQDQFGVVLMSLLAKKIENQG